MNTVLAWSSAAQTHVGMVRKINEDACLDSPEQGLWAVADGMGGHEAGDIASQMIIETLEQVPPSNSQEERIEAVKTCLQEVNRRLQEESALRYHHRTIGSTVVVFLIHGDQGICLWVGDSRIYRLRNRQLQQITRDHSHVQDLVDQGLIAPEDAHNHPMGNVITRAVGSEKLLDIDVKILPLQIDDVFLLCSDGLNKMLSDADITEPLIESDIREAVQTLTHTALTRGASDNVTTVVVKIKSHDTPT